MHAGRGRRGSDGGSVVDVLLNSSDVRAPRVEYSTVQHSLPEERTRPRILALYHTGNLLC